MIVTCQECQTQFQLDDAKVPETGIRVRCSRCKSAFFVESPHRPDPDHASQLAREALGIERAHLGESSRDSTLPEEESDWQFNEDVDPVDGAEDPVSDLAAARNAVDDLLGDVAAAPVDPATGETDPSEPPLNDFADDPGLDIQDTDFSLESGQGAEVGSEPEDDPNAVTVDRGTWAGHSADLSADSGLDLDGPLIADGADSSLEAHRDSIPESRLDPSGPFGEVSDDLGSPAGWDFFEDNDSPAAAGSAPVGGSLGPREANAVFGSDDSQAFAKIDDAEDFDVEASRGDAWFTRLRGVLGWAFVTVLCAYASTTMFFPELLAAAPDPVTLRVAGFEVAHVEGHWVENAVAGPIYVVSGALHNAGGTRPATGSVLQIRLLDAHGAKVVAESAAVGPPIPTARLRESNPRDLQAAQERAALAILRDPLERRKRRPFMAVFGNIPAAAVAFDFEVAPMTAPPPVSAASELNARAVPAPAEVEAGMPKQVRTSEAAAPAATR